MGRPRKKLKVHHVSHIETVSVTSYSSSTRGKQTVTRSTFHAPSSPRSIDTPAFSPAQDATNPPACDKAVKGPKKRYTSTVCVLSDLLFVLGCTLFIVELLTVDFVQRVLLTCPQDDPLNVWCHDCDAFLDELHWCHGRGCNVGIELCEECQSGTPLLGPGFRCLDCTPLPMMCSHFLVQNHKALPLHRIEVSEY